MAVAALLSQALPVVWVVYPQPGLTVERVALEV